MDNMNYYTQQDLCKEFETNRKTLWRVSVSLGLHPIRNGRVSYYDHNHYRMLSMYFYDLKVEAQLRLKALLITNYHGIKIRDIYSILRRDGVGMDMIESAIRSLTINDTMVWEKWDEEYVPDDLKWLQTCETEEELQEKRDEREYMESTLCYGYAWWYDEHLEDEDDNHVLCVDFKEEDNYTLA